MLGHAHTAPDLDRPRYLARPDRFVTSRAANSQSARDFLDGEHEREVVKRRDAAPVLLLAIFCGQRRHLLSLVRF